MIDDDVETIEGVVGQVIEPEDRDRYMLPPKVYDGLEPGEDLVVVLGDPLPDWFRAVSGAPVVGAVLEIVLWPLSALPPIRRTLDQERRVVAVDSGSVEEGDDVEIVAREAVVDETRPRSGEPDRTVHLFEAIEVSR